MRIAIYGTGKRAQRLVDVLNSKELGGENDIVYFIETKKTKNYFAGKKVISVNDVIYSDFDRLVISSDKYYNEMFDNLERISSQFDACKEKIINFNMLKETLYSELTKNWNDAQKIMPYRTCKVSDDIIYLSCSEDQVIPDEMFLSGMNYAKATIDIFFELKQKFYNRDSGKESGYFLDIGANIGTTSIYVKKKINNNLRVIGFEAGKSNYDLFRINCILNQVEDIKVEWLGISNANTKKKFGYNVQNSGGSWIRNDDAEGDNISLIETRKLDDYLKNNNIEAESIDYIWIDTEGHEGEIIEGAMETLRTKRIPLLQEFNPLAYLDKNTLEKYCKNISIVYDNFVDVSKYIAGNVQVIPTKNIYQFAMEMKKEGKAQADLFFF